MIMQQGGRGKTFHLSSNFIVYEVAAVTELTKHINPHTHG